MKHLILFFLLALALSAHATTTTIVPPGYTPVCPAQASAVGYTSLAFDDEFTTATTFTTSGSATSGYNWYPNYWAGAVAGDVSVSTGTLYAVSGTLTAKAPASPAAAQTAVGVMSIIGGGNLGSVPEYPNVTGLGAHPALTGSFNHCYYEARIQMAPKAAESENAFWSWSTSQFYNAAVKTGYVNTAENDFMEWVPDAPNPFYGCNTLHDWYGSTDKSNTNAENIMDSLVGNSTGPGTIMGDGNFHVYGCLWVALTPTTGYTQYYLDNQLVVHKGGVTRFLTGVGTGTSSGKVTTVNGVVCYTAPNAGLSSIEASNMYIIVGGETGWPLNVDWVHVWNGSGSGSGTGTTTPPAQQSLAGVPSSITIGAATSTLPATTSAGVAVTYTVTGPATISGDTLTVTGPGTITLTATAPATSSYAAFSQTYTITVSLEAQVIAKYPETLTLPAASSAGLPLTYGLVSGTGSFTGNALTVAAPGTVVWTASQPGNGTFAPAIATGTSTFP